MAKRYSHTEAFAHYGTKPHNVQWSWSALNEETGTVVVTLWQDELKGAGKGRLSYSRGPAAELGIDTRPGHRELMRNLAWARDHCDGRLRVIVAKAVDTTDYPRRIEECFPRDQIVLRLKHLDLETGAWSAETF